MVLEDSNAALHTITFELKVILNTPKKDFEDTLIKLGIKSWAKIIESKDESYYAFSDIQVIYPPAYYYSNGTTPGGFNRINSQVSLSTHSIDQQANIIADFDGKINCRLIFTNVTNIIYDISSRPENNASRSFNNKFNPVVQSEVINKHLKFWLDDKLDQYVNYQRIIWKFKSVLMLIDYDNYDFNYNYNDNDNDNDNKIDKLSFNDNNSNSSIASDDNIDFPLFRKGYSNYKTQKNLNQLGNLTTTSHNKWRVNSLLNKTTEKPCSSKRRRDINLFKSIGYDELLSKYTREYISLKAFMKKTTDTKNLVTLNEGIIEQFEVMPKLLHPIKTESERKGKKLKLCLNSIGIISIIIIAIVIIVKLL